MTTFLLKLGELTLKGGNRTEFEQILKRNLTTMLKGSRAVINCTQGRFFVHCEKDKESQVEAVLDRLIGIAGWAKARVCEKTVDAVVAACVAEAKALAEAGVKTFKVEARRADKGFPLDSYGIMRAAGEGICEAVPELQVDVQHPEQIISVEIRERAYVYGLSHRGRRGLPVGSAGRCLLLLSGGIDSPVAGYLMANRGMRLEAIYFHAYPYTSEEAQKKVHRLASIVSRYALSIKLHTIPFTQVQVRIKQRAPEQWSTVLLRMAMMDAAGRLARRNKIHCLVTGESLSQVASQTVENIQCTESTAKLPVFRPLIGLDKEETIRIARDIGTYDTSILPYEDCCVLFSPAHPILHGNIAEAQELYSGLELDEIIEEALHQDRIEKCNADDVEGSKL
ncbi:tRNA uracil 4-sulfurtransferase ThiI [Gracilinema caldarium]|uniref:Probable tRNA sulfurtransferase n=1 Tax=Gracilinema caldarium (strain ATCC 51460 / DSM 7334 / H1) TaxID=744872 RepID=F8F2R9_GRAC1|nr:tRNA uracil 4-sulfurtransferase ThiI [Gracilinema caldarium]AEJ19463.1 tRNA sulfurtransferase [Gracilinema caldarium DSM 7334]